MWGTVPEIGTVDGGSSEREHIILPGEVNESITVQVTFELGFN